MYNNTAQSPHTGHASVDNIDDDIQHGNRNDRTLVTLPAQSPALNLLDLGLFQEMKSEADGMMVSKVMVDTLIQRMKGACVS